MRKAKRVECFCLGLLLLGCASRATAAEQQVGKFGYSADYYSKYIWRGQVLSDKSVLQPAISVSDYGFTASLWGNMNLSNSDNIVPDNAGEFSELDWTLDYTAAVPVTDNLNFSIGSIYYRFPNQIYRPTTEVYAGLSVLNGLFSPSIKLYHDIDEIDASYVQLGIGHTYEKIHVVSENCYCDLQLGASAGWGSNGYNHGYFGADGSEFNDLTLNVGLPLCIYSWTIRAGAGFSTMLSSDIRRATDKSDNFRAGFGLSKSF